MSTEPVLIPNIHSISPQTKIMEDNNNSNNKFAERQCAHTFTAWYRKMIDDERQNISLYISDDAILEWFGRTIKGRKKIAMFLRSDMQCSRHDFTTIESIEKIQSRQERFPRRGDFNLASPLDMLEEHDTIERHCKKRLRSECGSPEWAPGCKPDNEDAPEPTQRKRLKSNPTEYLNVSDEGSRKKDLLFGDTCEVNNKGDGEIDKRTKRKCVPVTPPNKEVGQGDCLPSTSGVQAKKSHETLNAQLPKLAVECKGYIEFMRTRNRRSTDSMKWERKCKVQISYSEDPLNVGEYIIWSLHYTDESKCRRNLLPAFEEAAKLED